MSHATHHRPERVAQLGRMLSELRQHRAPARDTPRLAPELELTPTPTTSPPFRLVTAELRRAYEPSAFVVWRNITVQPELLNAFSDLVFFPAEALSALFAAQRAEQRLLSAAEAVGTPRALCNFVRAIPGGRALDLFATPNLLVNVAKGCEGLTNAYCHAARHYRAEAFTVHVPYDAESSPSATAHVQAQLRELTDRVRVLSGESPSSSRQFEVLSCALATHATFAQVLRLRSRYPLLDPPSVYQSITIGVSPFYGRPALLDHACAMLRAYETRLLSDPSLNKQPARRLLWMFLMPYYPNDLVEYIERDGLCRFVWEDISELDFKDYDPADPYPGMALALLRSRESVRPERRFVRLMAQAEEHRIDGVVMWGMPHCGVYHMQYPMLSRLFERERIPCLVLDACAVDPQTFNTGQIRTRIDAFREILLSRPSRWSGT